MAESSKLCTSGPSEGGLDAEGLAAGGNQHFELTHEPCQELERHFKEEPDQSKELSKALAVKLELEDTEEEYMVEDPEELTEEFREEPSPYVDESRDSEPEPESQGCPWSLYYSGYPCPFQRRRRAAAHSLKSPPRLQMPSSRGGGPMVFYQHKGLSERSVCLETRKAEEEQQQELEELEEEEQQQEQEELEEEEQQQELEELEEEQEEAP